MPITALGQYEIAVTAGQPDRTPERFLTPFFYFPTTRILSLVLLLAGGIFLARRPWRHWKKTGRTWLWLLVVIGVPAQLLGPFLGDFTEGLGAIICGEVLAVAATLWFVCRCRVRCRAGLFFLALAICATSVCISMSIAYGEWGMFLMFLVAAALFSTYCVLTVALGFIAVRRTFSGGRLLLGLVLAMPCVAACVTLAASFIPGMSVGWESILPLLIMPLPYLGALYLYAVFNRPCREGSIRGLALNQGTASPTSCSQQSSS
jgi:hypothetical protein